MLIMIFKESLIKSQKVVLWIQLTTFISKALSDWMRILVQSSENSIFYVVTQAATSLCERIRILVLYFFVINVGILAEKLRSMSFEELKLRLQKHKLKWMITIFIFSVAAIFVLTMIILRHQVNWEQEQLSHYHRITDLIMLSLRAILLLIDFAVVVMFL
jgi:hypothetical protein